MIVAAEALIIVDWTVPTEFVVVNDMVIDCRAGMIASQMAFQYFVAPPNVHDAAESAEVMARYSAALENPVPATVVIVFAPPPPIVPAVSVIEL